MDQQWDSGEEAPRVPRRGEYSPPPWFGKEEVPPPEDAGEASHARRLSLPRTVGLLALVVLIIWVPVEFGIAYYGHDDALGRTNMTLGFVWAVGMEAFAVWGLIRLLTRR